MDTCICVSPYILLTANKGASAFLQPYFPQVIRGIIVVQWEIAIGGFFTKEFKILGKDETILKWGKSVLAHD